MDYEDMEEQEAYDPDVFEEFGEGFEEDFNDAVSEKIYEKAFDEASMEATAKASIAPLPAEEEINEDDYEFDAVVGGRDKKPVMSMLNKGKLSKYEMDELLNQIE